MADYLWFLEDAPRTSRVLRHRPGCRSANCDLDSTDSTHYYLTTAGRFGIHRSGTLNERTSACAYRPIGLIPRARSRELYNALSPGVIRRKIRAARVLTAGLLIKSMKGSGGLKKHGFHRRPRLPCVPVLDTAGRAISRCCLSFRSSKTNSAIFPAAARAFICIQSSEFFRGIK